jgi:hypothetical protein
MQINVDAPVRLDIDDMGGRDRVMVYPLTPCCNASGKGGGYGVVCRNCYQDVASGYGSCSALLGPGEEPDSFFWMEYHQLLQEEIWDFDFQGEQVSKEADKWVEQAKKELAEL